MEDLISKALGIPTQSPQKATESLPVAQPDKTPIQLPIYSEPNVENDLRFSRDNLYLLLTKGVDAMDELVQIAKDSQHPRAYEVLSNLIRNLGETNERILDIHLKMKELNENNTPPNVKVDKAVFVGSTAELLNMIKKKSTEISEE